MTQVKLVDVAEQQAIFDGNGWDALVVVSHSVTELPIEEVAMLAQHAAGIDKRVGQQPTLQFAPGLAGGRLILSPVTQCGDDYADVRVFAKAMRDGLRLAIDSGAKQPLLVVEGPEQQRYQFATQVAALAVGQELWQPLELREAKKLAAQLKSVGLLQQSVANMVNALEAGRMLARDLGGTEPERMSAPAFAEYCVTHFADLPVNIEVIEERSELERDYPLLCAVGRSSFDVLRHQPRVVTLEYVPDGEVTATYLFAGKGVVYDTGGADLKVGGAMAGMSRDKGGAAAVAGLMKTIALLRPKGIRVIAQLGLVRNSIGSEAFVPDEIISSHANCRVRIGNTDAEGRLVLADLLSHLRLQAVNAVNPQLFSVATLTGHVVRAYGGYTALVENAVAQCSGLADELQRHGQLWGEPMEISSLRPEDFDRIVDPSGAADALSSNNAPSSITMRGHQYPAAFLQVASGLDRHGLAATLPLPYMHIDIAGSAVEGNPLYGKPTAEPLVGLYQYIQSRS